MDKNTNHEIILMHVLKLPILIYLIAYFNFYFVLHINPINIFVSYTKCFSDIRQSIGF